MLLKKSARLFKRPTRRSGAAASALALLFFTTSLRTGAGTAPVVVLPSLHTFTNDKGISVRGQILSVVGDEVNLKREDGQTFRPKIALFIPADQAYIYQWIIKDAATHDKEVLNIRATSSHGVAEVKNDHTAHVGTSTWLETYQLTLKNMTSATWAPLQVRYIIFLQTVNFGFSGSDAYTDARVTHSVTVDRLGGNEIKNVALDKITLSSYIKIDNHIWAGGLENAMSDKVKGLWVRVYDDMGDLVQEWVSDPDIPKTERWVYPQPATSTTTIILH